MRYAIAIILVAVGLLLMQQHTIHKLQGQNDSLSQSKSALLDSVHHYKSSEGLNAAEMAAVRLSVDELRKYREQDLKLIETLKTKGRDIEHYVTVNTHTRDTIYTSLHDSIVVRDTVRVDVRAINVDKRWYSLHGYIDGDTLTGTLTTRSELKIVETVKYKRFLGFLWKTNKVKDRKVDVVSLNPNETIEHVDFTIVEK